jgi:glucosylglycerate synthase
MAKLEVAEEAKKRIEEGGTADLLIAIAAPVDVEKLRATATEAMLSATKGAAATFPGLRAVVAFPGPPAAPEAAVAPLNLESESSESELRFLPYVPPATNSVIPWLGLSTTYQALFGIARGLDVRACAVVASDLAALGADQLSRLLSPVLGGTCDLAMPLYPMGKFEGLLNLSILAPLTRALYGRRVRFPLAPDFGISAHMLPELEQPRQRITSQGNTLFWPATEAALRDRRICEVYLNVHHPAAADGVDLTTVLSQTVAPLFAEMEVNAAAWQRVRGSHPVEQTGPELKPPADAATVDARPMLETFQLGFRNLQEVWSLVLPPVTLLELKRLSRLPAEQFRMPDELWVRIVYDFALAFRLRTLSRSHLPGALAPLYLGWAASYVLEVGNARVHEVEQRVERLARAYEEGKPYLLSRWRWPDRFNP